MQHAVADAITVVTPSSGSLSPPMHSRVRAIEHLCYPMLYPSESLTNINTGIGRVIYALTAADLLDKY